MNASSAGTISGGSLTKRSLPSFSVVSSASAFRWSLLWALATRRSTSSFMVPLA